METTTGESQKASNSRAHALVYSVVFLALLSIGLGVALIVVAVQDDDCDDCVACPLPATTAAPQFSPAFVPANAQGQRPNSQGFITKQLGRGVYWFGEGFNQAMIVIGSAGVTVVDAPYPNTMPLVRAIKNLTSLPVTTLVYSHHHCDHICGATMTNFPNVTTVYAHEFTRDRIVHGFNNSMNYAKGLHLPTNIVPNNGSTVTVTIPAAGGALTLELKHVARVHAETDIWVWAPEQKVLMNVDIIYPGWLPFVNLAYASNLRLYFNVTQMALEYPFEHIISGHFTRPGNRTDVMTQQEYIRDLGIAIHNANKVAFNPQSIVPSPNGFSMFMPAFQRMANLCAEELRPKWYTRLGGAGTPGIIEGHCLTSWIYVVHG